MKDPYHTLGINKDVTAEDVKKAYFDLAKKYHPDGGDEQMIEKFHDIAKAYRLLTNKEERRIYDLSQETDIDKDIYAEVTKHPTRHPEERKDRGEREKEYRAFKKMILLRAIAKTIILSIIIGIIGGTFGALFNEPYPLISFIIAFLMGGAFGFYQYFDIDSMLSKTGQGELIKRLGMIAFVGGVGYFVWLVVNNYV